MERPSLAPMPHPRPWPCTPRAGWQGSRRWRRPGGRGDDGSCGGLQGEGQVDGTGEEGLLEDDPGRAGVADPPQAVEVADAAGDQDLGAGCPDEGSDEIG